MKHKFSVGDRVTFTNEQGVVFPEKKIVVTVNNPVRGLTYRIAPTDTPWFDVNEANLATAN